MLGVEVLEAHRLLDLMKKRVFVPWLLVSKEIDPWVELEGRQMQTIDVVDRAALALLQHLLALARLCSVGPSLALIHGRMLLDASLFFARLRMAGLQRATPGCQCEHWGRSEGKGLQLSMVVVLVSCA